MGGRRWWASYTAGDSRPREIVRDQNASNMWPGAALEVSDSLLTVASPDVPPPEDEEGDRKSDEHVYREDDRGLRD